MITLIPISRRLEMAQDDLDCIRDWYAIRRSSLTPEREQTIAEILGELAEITEQARGLVMGDEPVARGTT